MHILILTFGSRGDVQPYVALGAALLARGHKVTIATGKGFEPFIREHGLEVATLSVDFQELINQPEMKEALRTVSGKFKAWRSSQDLMRRLLNEIWAVSRDLQPDLIAYHVKGAAAIHVAEALGIRAVPTFLIPAMVPTGAFPNPIFSIPDISAFTNRLSHVLLAKLTATFGSGMIRDWRRDLLGLSTPGPRGPMEGYAPDGSTLERLHGYSAHLIPRPADWQARERITGYWVLDQQSEWQPPENLTRFLEKGSAPVYIGFGSMPAEDAGRLTRLVINAVAQSGERAVLATGWGGLTASDAPESIHVLDAAPHDWLFPRCAAVVHHGGAGTTHEGLRWGRPTFICPVFGDQPFWGKRIAALGAGPAPVPQKRLTTDNFADALRALKDPDIGKRATEIGDAMQGETGAETAADILISLGG